MREALTYSAEELEQAVESFDVLKAQAYLPEDRERLFLIMEDSFDDLEVFTSWCGAC